MSVDVGDVKERISGLSGCYLADKKAEMISEQLIKAFAFQGRTEGRRRIEEKELTNDLIAKKIIDVYKKVKR